MRERCSLHCTLPFFKVLSLLLLLLLLPTHLL
jgi:hypothetical protein